VNNPVSILNQEMSKRFLASTDPSDKYKFFMKSTHLEQMILDYQVGIHSFSLTWAGYISQILVRTKIGAC